jgi:small redox-active disulfide protein 2
MKENEITRIRINNNLVGIVGMEAAMSAMAGDHANRGDEEIGAEILKRLEAQNYIPAKARPLYAKALVREFRQYLGQPVAGESLGGVHVVILGPGCAQCDRLERDVREVMEEMQLAAELNHVTDIREIGRYGVMGVPALIINDKVVCVGQAPNRNRIRDWLQEAMQAS